MVEEDEAAGQIGEGLKREAYSEVPHSFLFKDNPIKTHFLINIVFPINLYFEYVNIIIFNNEFRSHLNEANSL